MDLPVQVFQSRIDHTGSIYRRSSVKLKFHWDQFLVTSSRTCWRRRQLPHNKLAISYEEVSDTPDHLDMSRWSESRQLPRNFLVTSWRLSRNICYGEVTEKLVPVEFKLNAIDAHLAELSLTAAISCKLVSIKW